MFLVFITIGGKFSAMMLSCKCSRSVSHVNVFEPFGDAFGAIGPVNSDSFGQIRVREAEILFMAHVSD